jgi:peptidoglycan/LPS O-acetylase OafA/YrhL
VNPSPRPRRLAWVDAVRGLCAAVVTFHHARGLFRGVDGALGALSPWCLALGRAISGRNTEAVIVFFVLSGFSIRLSVEGRSVGTGEGLRDYYARRARRVLPLYWLSLAAAWLVAVSVAPLPDGWLAPWTLVGNLVFLQTAVGVPGAWVLPWAGNGPLWSLSFEVFFYAAYPWLLRTTPDPRLRWVIVMLVTALGFVGNALAPNPLTMFCAASVIWYLGVDLAERWLGAPGAGLWWVVSLCLVGAGLRFGLSTAAGLAFHGLWVAASVSLLLALAFEARRRAGVRGVEVGEGRSAPGVDAGAGALIWLGSISYALYLLHVPVLRAAAALLGSSASAALLAVAISVAVAFYAERWAGRFRSAAPNGVHVAGGRRAGSGLADHG